MVNKMYEINVAYVKNRIKSTLQQASFL